MKHVPIFLLLAVGVATADEGGSFRRDWWFEAGIEHGNPVTNRRFRVNAPEVVLDPRFKDRSEVRGNGMMLVSIEEDLALLAGASLYLELWGGHPGTARKRLTVNGRSTYALDENGTASGNCTHAYPEVELRVTDLVNGHNAIQFACDQGESFWGHFIVDNACLRTVLRPDHPDLAAAGLGGFGAQVAAAPAADETLRLELEVTAAHRDAVETVEFHGLYDGYDERGAGRSRGWHGFTKAREPVAVLGTASDRPFAVDWDVSMLPAQEDVEVRAVVRFRGRPRLSFVTPPAKGLAIPRRAGRRVRIHAARDLPRPFWSRASMPKTCAIEIDVPPESIERAELHVVLWDGGRGEVEHPFTLNGHPVPVAGAGRHDVLYRRVELDPAILEQGRNEVRVLSDTDHHGIEVLLPGPAIVVRSRT